MFRRKKNDRNLLIINSTIKFILNHIPSFFLANLNLLLEYYNASQFCQRNLSGFKNLKGLLQAILGRLILHKLFIFRDIQKPF